MSHLYNHTVIYRCSDDISHLKIRIKLSPENSDRWDERVFAWQEKVFGKAEREFYSDEKNCITDLDRKYHSEVATSENPCTEIDLFSYTNEDEFVSQQSSICVPKSDEKAEDFDYKQSLLAAVRNPVSYNYDVMYIMADLGEYVDSTWIKYEKVICTIKYNKQLGVLSINPDFTTFEPYFVEIDGTTTRNFQYYIENASQVMDEDDQIKENELIRKINKLATLDLGDLKFALPAKNKLRVSLVFEVVWGKRFEHDTIYVQYVIDLGPEWSCDDPAKLRGVTQTCHTKPEDGSAHFGHVFELTLECDIRQLKYPYIYFEVMSKDGWSRFRTEGLTYTHLPVSRPGNYKYELPCVRLVPNSVSGQLRRFFVGDCSSYDDVTWIGVPKEHEVRESAPFCAGAILNKYGTNTLGTGEICVRINVLHHAFQEDRESGEVFEKLNKLNSSSLVKSVEQVLRAFRRARKNMIAARKNF